MNAVQSARAILGVLALSLAPTVATGQPTVEKPTFKVGDRWVFNMPVLPSENGLY